MSTTPQPFSFILFGASGHLAKIKIFPALYYLALKKRLPDQYTIVGFSRTSMTDEQFKESISKAVRDEAGSVIESVLEELLQHCSYHTGRYDDVASFRSLATKLDGVEVTPSQTRVAYLSIPPSVFTPTVRHLGEGGVHNKVHPFRCIVEKPVGHHRSSFEDELQVLHSVFSQDEVYILDHYLGKEAVRNVYYLRHANPVIERLMKNTLINHVQITATETAGLEGRAGYFDAVGTLRDMFQSHLLQIAALLTMRLVNDTKDLKATRLDAIRKLFLPSAASVSDLVLQAQYTSGDIQGTHVPAYVEEKDVQPGSRASTYCAMRLQSRSSRWDGVPFFLSSGKRLQQKETKIVIEFQESPTLVGKNEAKNRLEIILQGEAGMKFHLQTKLGGSAPVFRPLVMADPLICMGDCLPEHSILILEAIEGVKQWFLDPEEVRHSWGIIDPLQAYIDEPTTPLFLYAAGSKNPKESEAFIAQFGYQWL